MVDISTAARGNTAGERTSLLGRILDPIAPFLLVGILLIAWAVVAQLRLVMPFLLPAPLDVLRWLVDDVVRGTFFVNAAWTLYRALVGFALASVIGVLIGVLMSRSKLVHWFFDPIVSIGLPIPKIALLPIFMLWFGFFDASKILMVAFSACFQIIASTWQATQTVDRQLIWSARAVGASEHQILYQIILPAASPQIITGLQITFPLCLIVVVVTEMQMGGLGLGNAMLSAGRYAQTAGVFAGIIQIGLVGLISIKTMEWLRRRLLVWHKEAAEDES